MTTSLIGREVIKQPYYPSGTIVAVLVAGKTNEPVLIVEDPDGELNAVNLIGVCLEPEPRP